MPTFAKIESRPTFRDMAGRFAKSSKEVISARRDAVRAMGKKYVVAAKKEAPKGETGKFANSIGFQTYQTTDGVGFRAYASQPLFTWITEGTDPHIIRGNPILAFFWQRGPAGPGMYFYHWVNHPGTKPNPFHLRAYDEVKDEFDVELAKISTRVFNSLKGK